MTDITKLLIAGQTCQQGQQQTKADKYWKGSPFEWFRRLASRSKGATGERMVADILEGNGSVVPRDPAGKPTKPKGSGTDFDIFPDNLPTEVKTSSAWEATDNKFVWQQLRSKQKYERVVFLGLNASGAQAWWCTKGDLEQHIFGRDEFRQHAGKKGEQDLYWIHTEGGTVASVPSWFRTMETWHD